MNKMNSDSALFDSIRIGRSKAARKKEPAQRICEWPDCTADGTHPAPRGGTENSGYHYFCLSHVREYNRQFNYFRGMDEDAVREFQADPARAAGSGPTTTLHLNRGRQSSSPITERPRQTESDLARARRKAGISGPSAAPRRAPGPLERRALALLKIAPGASSEDIKTRYKELVKIHHPDLNGGDRSSEDELRSIIQAYSLLKKSGFCS